MKNTNLSTLFSCVTLMLLSLSSCRKESGPTKPHDTSSLKLDLSYHPNNPDITNFELIVSRLNDSVLLDTVAMVDTKISATLMTSDSFFNVTVVHYYNQIDQYTVNTYLQVNPAHWTTITNGSPGYYSPIYFPPYTAATLHYYNAPAGQLYFSNTPAPELSTITTGPGTVDVSYNRHTGAYAYLLFPTQGLYNLRLPQTDADSVDLSHIDTAVTVNFTKPAPYQLFFTNLNGFMDTTDYLKYLVLYSSFYMNSPYDLEYPAKLVQKYELAATWSNGMQGYSSYYYFDHTMPAAGDIPFLQETNYSIGSSRVDSFAIQFANVHPSYYETQWSSPKINWNLFAAPDSAILHPLHLLSAQQSSYLHGQDLSALTLNTLSIEAAQDYNYANHFNYVFNPDLLSKKLLKASLSFQKFFQ